MKERTLLLAAVFISSLIALLFAPSIWAEDQLPIYLRDRGTGIPTSMFGTYVRSGELLVYPYVEYYYDNDMEYTPREMGYGLDEDFRGKYRATEGLLFLGYGVTDWLALELEAAVITAELHKSDRDPSDMPDVIEESGLGDVETQIRWRWFEEKESRPELFSFFETVYPLQKHRKLIGTRDWELTLGVGIIKGFSWGTGTLRLAAAHDREEQETELGEYAVEYLKRISDGFRVFAAVEGEGDEVELITELQWHMRENMFVKFNCGFGLTSKATDYAPEVGIMLSF